MSTYLEMGDLNLKSNRGTLQTMLSHIQQHIEEFTDKLLWREKWFNDLDRSGSWDLMVLAGSHVRGDADPRSDIDLFLVLPHIKQVEYDLPPVHSYEWNDLNIEISKVSSEILRNSVIDKRNLFWWHRAKVVRSNNEELRKVFDEASRVSRDELTVLLWNIYCIFKMNADENLPKALQLGDDVGARCCFYNNVDCVMEAILYANQIFVANKKRGSCLQKVAPDVYKRIRSYVMEPSVDYMKETKALEHIIQKTLQDNGFTEEELATWHKRNLHRFLHQAI